MWFRNQKKGAIFRPALVLLSVATIAFPPNVFADAITFQWNGSADSNFSNANNWTCDPTCATSPDNTAAGAAVDAIINSGQPDSVLLDTPSVITSLSLGGVSPTSTLTTNGPSLTLGTPADYRYNVLAVNGGGTLNINNATVTLDMSGRDGFNASGALVDSGGSLSVTSGTLALRNSVNDGNAAVVTNNGSINLDAASSLTLGADAQIMVDGWGTLNLSGGTVAGSGSASLTNGEGHALVGSGQIQANFNNLGLLEASGGNLSVLSSAQVDTDIDTGASSLTHGTYVVDDGAQLQFTQLGSNSLQSIQHSADVTVKGTGMITNGAGANALVGLSSLNGSLLLDQNASLTLDHSQPAFEVGGDGYLTVDNGSTLDTSARAFSNVDSQGVLTHGSFGVGDGAKLKYSSSSDITAIGEAAELDLAGSGQVLNTDFGDAHDALSGSLTTVDGTLTLNPFDDAAHAATLTLANQLTNHANVNVNMGSTLTTQGFVNYADEFSSSCGCGASFQLAGGTAQINGDLTNHAAIVEPDGFGEPSVEIGIDQGSSVHVTGDVLNSATSANSETSGSSAYMWLDNQSSLTVDGNLTNDSHGMGGYGSSPAELDIDSATVTVGRQVSNLGGSAILMDSVDGSGSTLNANGGLVNSNSFIFLVNGGTLNVGQTSGSAAQSDQPTWALQNLSDDSLSGSAPNISLLQVGYPQLGGPPGINEEYAPAASVLNVTGGLLNQAASGNDGYSTSIVDVDSGSILNADRVLNSAMAGGGVGSPEAEINVTNGSAMNVTTLDHTGVLTNSASAVGGFAYADVTVSGGSTLVADSVVNQFTSSPDGVGAATISVDASTMTVNNTFNNLGGVLNLTNAATVTVNGQFTNDARGIVSLDGDQGVPSLSAADGLTGSVLNTNGFSNSGQVNLLQESTINNTGDFQNSGTITIDNHSALNIRPQSTGEGSTLSSASSPVLTNTGTIATGTIAGGGNQIVVQGDAFNTAPGVINIHGEDDSMTVTGQFTNSGSVAIGNGATIQATTYTQTDGTTDIGQGGTLQADVYVMGGTVSGDGQIVGNVTVDGGTLAPGDPQSIDIIGNYTQTLAGILDVDLVGLGDGEYDQVNVMSDDQHPDGGNVSLGGTLEVTLEDGFGAGINIGDVFHILTWTGERAAGTDFDFFRNSEFWNGSQNLWFQEVLVDGGVDLTVVATPEPSTLAMLFGVMLLAGGAVRMRRRRYGIR